MRISTNPYLRIGPVTKSEVPFPHAFSPNAFNVEFSMELLSWLEKSAPWSLTETDFYEQYEFSFYDINLPSNLVSLSDYEYLNQIKIFMENVFAITLDDKIDCTAHKLIPGQRIRIHNDFIPDMETHRLLIQLNRGWIDENGGMLMLFNSTDPNDLGKIYRPIHNSAFAFEISAKSNHAVSTIKEGERFTLVYSFYRSKE
ncbi:cyclophane-containing peptide 2OG-Fe(II) oxygenase YhhC [Nitrosomonas oligotropha]|uniref:2OG-Fe(II) oxygenase superfamily protein n=1 Tax=Nitrosomonas oligotropha TaxID=42354 RepID=A0A1H8T4W1_9PROT|nr:cyclophane-containing peptide 2OG-Fe(II) oxygenase YhhC [Nitrosomonas oligotropha]SDX21835.1 2OG-Fe(II) oxygenase superfamily protein [Nitrosomonas oligotropha]SEO86060.1 2OG-Fe(II) oxygenase superfamily protein [Nitrosomonas oligotropha]